MNKTDIAFYLSVVVLTWTNVSEMVKPLISGNVFNWIAVVAVVVSTISYAFYGKLTDTREVSNGSI